MECKEIFPKVEKKYSLTITQHELNVLRHVGNCTGRVAALLSEDDSLFSKQEIINVLYNVYAAFRNFYTKER